MHFSKAAIFAASVIIGSSAANVAMANSHRIPRVYQDIYSVDSLTVKAGHFFEIIGYEVVRAPDNFFYSHSMTMFNSEPFTHTGFLGNNVGASGQIFGGWALGWDTGFPDTKDSAAVFGGSASISFPFYDAGSWAVRGQANGAISGMQSPFPNGGIDPYVGASFQVYLQSISGNAIGVGTGIVSESDELDAQIYEAFAMYGVNKITSRSRITLGEIDFNSGQSRDFFTIGSEHTFALHGDMFSIGLVAEYGEVEDDRAFTYVGLNFDFAPNIQQNHTFFTQVGRVDIDYDNPFQNDRDYWFTKFGIRIDLNEGQQTTGNPLTLRARQILNTPWSGSAPKLLEYGL